MIADWLKNLSLQDRFLLVAIILGTISTVLMEQGLEDLQRVIDSTPR